MEEIYRDTAHLEAECKRLGIRDWLFAHNPGIEAPIFRGLGLLLLLPLFIISIIPTGLLFIIPRIFTKKLIKDQMFISSFNVAVSALVSIPICQLLPSIVLWIFAGFWWAFGYFMAFPFMFILVWNYMRLWQKFKGSCNYVRPKNRAAVAELRKLRESIYHRLDSLID